MNNYILVHILESFQLQESCTWYQIFYKVDLDKFKGILEMKISQKHKI